MAVEDKIRKSIKPLVRSFYIDGMDVSDICDCFAGLNPSTVYNWAKAGKWADEKNSKVKLYISSPDILMRALDTMLQKLMEEKTDDDGNDISILSNPDKVVKISDAVSKIVKSIKSLSKNKDYLASIVFTTAEFSKFMNTNKDVDYDMEFRENFIKALSIFQIRMIEKYSPKNFA